MIRFAMHLVAAGFFSLGFGISAPALGAQAVANPVLVPASSHDANKAHDVTCSNANGTAGNWIQVTESVVTAQPALIYSDRSGGTQQSILYCIGTDGRAGIITNAPLGLLLPTGTHVSILPSVNVQYLGASASARFQDSWPLAPSGSLHVLKSGIILMPNAHIMYVYPPGATVTVISGAAATYVRPDPYGFRPVAAQVGCVVQRIATNGLPESTRKYSQGDCLQLLSSGSF